MSNNPRILKLSNGDEIICMVLDTENDYMKVSLPLKLINMTTMNKRGEYEENLALRKWATFTDEKTFAIERSQIVVHHGVNIGLSKYYQYIIKKYKEFDNYSALDKANSKLEKKMKEEISEEDKFENAVEEYCNYYYDEDESKKNN
tara:strand:- start:443 stop:880 length:438 start_codon:yes stop_codon:yes gene_type:complete